MTIELYYFDGCPSYPQALDNLIAALALERLPAEVEMIRVRGTTDAEAKCFPGSPTIRINGEDIDVAPADGRGFVYGCRMYEEDGRRAGWPSVDRIRQAIQRERTGA
ncbi:MAG TPA: hypothetical protein VMM93_12335 [Vicinamibacterales bacterium]|nr:hypothetical protein [Vicinamibacterales bacterium]